MRIRARVEVDPITRAIERIRRRATLRSLLRRAPFALVASVSFLLAGAAAAGPYPALVVLAFVAVAAFLPFFVLGLLAARELAPLDGSAAAILLAGSRPWLASALRSAAEFGGRPSGSSELLVAHRAAVHDALDRVDLATELDLRRPVRGFAIALVAAVAVAGLAARFEPHVAAGLYALSHPLAKRDGDRLALVVADLKITASPPRHRGGQAAELANPTTLSVDEGARLAIDLTLRSAASTVTVDFAGTTAQLSRVDDRRFRGEATARSSGPVAIRVRTASDRLVDATSRRIVVRDDAPPVVHVIAIDPEGPYARDAEVTIQLEATDDVGVAEVSQTLRTPNRTETRTVLATPERGTCATAASTTVRLSDYDLRPGDAVTVTLEVKDDDSVDGPKTSRTEPISLVVDDGRDARERATADLRALLDDAIGTLALRLEIDEPVAGPSAIERATRLASGARALAERIRATASTPADDLRLSSPDRGLLRGFERRLIAMASADETAAPRGVDAMQRADQAATAAMEDMVLALADLLGRMELQDAAAIAREIAALQRELASQVRELRENPSDSLRAAIRATMQRIRQRMAELGQKLASMKDELPAEFRNAAAASSGEAQDALSALEQALQSDDLDAAERSVAELEQALRQMTERAADTEDDLDQTRFGPRQQAFAAAFESLSELEVEQATLASESARIRDGLSQRAAEALGDERTNGLGQLAAEARRVVDQLRRIQRIPGAPVDDDAIERAVARLDDAREALSRGDLGEAREMMNRTTGTVEAIASDLELSRRMFDALDRRTAQAAESARQAADAARALDDAITRALPSLQEQIRDADQGAMTANATRQTRARESAGRIAESMGGDALGEPIAPDIAEGIREAQGMMSEAETAMGRRDTVGAANAEARAARRLQELREQIEQQSSSGGGGGGGSSGGGGGSDGGRSDEAAVEVPGASGSQDAASRRRRVLDAMGEDVPEAYRGSVRRYYEELLR